MRNIAGGAGGLFRASFEYHPQYLIYGRGSCAPGLSYQARPTDPMGFGYTDKKVDALHYSVASVDDREDQAQNFLELRAA
jgi:hypothetical protein